MFARDREIGAWVCGRRGGIGLWCWARWDRGDLRKFGCVARLGGGRGWIVVAGGWGLASSEYWMW